MKTVSTISQMEVSKYHFVALTAWFLISLWLFVGKDTNIIYVDFYDPDGYYFNKEGYDEFGGYYEGLYYFPGPGNKHEF